MKGKNFIETLAITSTNLKRSEHNWIHLMTSSDRAQVKW